MRARLRQWRIRFGLWVAGKETRGLVASALLWRREAQRQARETAMQRRVERVARRYGKGGTA